MCCSGAAALIVQGIAADVRGIRIEWLLLVIVYIGVYKSPGTGVLISLILGLLLDLYSGAVLGEGLFCVFFVMGYARLISRMIYVDRLTLMFPAILATMFSLYGVLAVITLLWGKTVGTFGSFIVTSCLSALLTALAGVLLLPVLKYFDPGTGRILSNPFHAGGMGRAARVEAAPEPDYQCVQLFKELTRHGR